MGPITARPTLPELRQRLANLHDERFAAELADDFAYTNGTIRRIDDEIVRVRQEIQRFERTAA